MSRNENDTWAGFVPRSERIAQKRRRAQANRRARMSAALAIDPYCRCGVQLRIVTDPAEIKLCPPEMALITPDGEVCCPECRQLRSGLSAA